MVSTFEYGTQNASVYNLFGDKVNSDNARNGLKIADTLIEIYLFHRKFQTKEYKESCNRVWSDE